MASYTTLRVGSKGNDVTELQKKLNAQGYGLAEDGIYGQKTKAAVRDYQSKNGLSIDGIAGNDTLGKLYSISTPSNNNSNNSESSSLTYDSSTGYAPSTEVNDAYEKLQTALNNKPGDYTSSYSEQLQAIYDKIMNREDFSYDMNADMLYQQYKDQYTNLGKMAMQDTMGQAAALTGGYGSSYASTAGNQAYQQYLSQLNEVIPELYQLALDKYDRDTNTMLRQYELTGELENQDYNRYRDMYNNWLTERDYLNNRYNTERDYDYGQYIDDRNYQYQVDRDKINDEQWQKEFDEAKRQYDQQYALSTNKSGSGTGSGGRSSSGSLSSNSESSQTNTLNQTLTAKDFKNSVMSKVEFELNGNYSSGKRYNSYKDYIRDALQNWTNNGLSNGKTLTDSAVAELMSYYGL